MLPVSQPVFLHSLPFKHGKNTQADIFALKQCYYSSRDKVIPKSWKVLLTKSDMPDWKYDAIAKKWLATSDCKKKQIWKKTHIYKDSKQMYKQQILSFTAQSSIYKCENMVALGRNSLLQTRGWPPRRWLLEITFWIQHLLIHLNLYGPLQCFYYKGIHSYFKWQGQSKVLNFPNQEIERKREWAH